MRRASVLALPLLFVAGQAGAADAQPEGAAPPPLNITRSPPRVGPPPPSEGFQMAFRTGASFPIGDATAAPGDALSRRYAWQVPLSFDLGFKIGHSFLVGAYLGFATGAEGSDLSTESACEDDDSNLSDDVSCSAHTVRIGLEARYYFSPEEDWDPWLSYGAGFETATVQLDDERNLYREATTVYGFTLAKVSAGIDYRAGKTVGVGPFADVAVGTFTRTVTEVNDEIRFDGEVEDPAWHAWLTVGVRMVLFP